MTRMPDIFAEVLAEFERGVQAAEDRITRHAGATQAPAATPVTVDAAEAAAPAPQENRMSLATDARALADRLEAMGEDSVTIAEQLGKDGLTMAAAVTANPATADLLAVIAKVAGIPVDPALFGAIKTILQPYVPVNADPAQQAAA